LGFVSALTSYDVGGGPALCAAGSFSSMPDSLDAFIAHWGCPDSAAPLLSCPPSVTVRSSSDGFGEVVTFSVTATDDLDPAPVVVCVPPSGSYFSRGTTIVHCTATDASGNQSTCQFPVSVHPKARRMTPP
jgi:hypothetical protein